MKPSPVRVLVVDDEPSILRMLRSCLAREGFKCETESDPWKALERIRTGTPVHILLTDIVMPGVDGLALLRALRVEECLTQAIVMTAYSTLDRVLVAYRLGALDYLIKPFESLSVVAEAVLRAEHRYRRWQRVVAETMRGDAA